MVAAVEHKQRFLVEQVAVAAEELVLELADHAEVPALDQMELLTAVPELQLLAVPVDKVCGLYQHLKTYADVSEWRLNMIAHFFEHYKDLDKGKWVKIDGWAGIEEARTEILAIVERFNIAKVKPAF